MKYDEYKESKKKKEEENASLKILKSLAEKEDIDYSGLLEQITNKTIDLSDVLSAIKGIPTPEKTDISPVVEAIKEIKIPKQTEVKIPEHKPDKESHKLLTEILKELKKKSKQALVDKKKQDKINSLIKVLQKKIIDFEDDLGKQELEFSVLRETPPDLTGYVPYTGATGDVDLGEHDLTTTGKVTIGDLSDSYYNLHIKGGLNGSSLVRLERTGFKFDWALTGGGLTFKNPDYAGLALNLFSTDTEAKAYLGQYSGPINKSGLLGAGTRKGGTETDASSGNLKLQGGLGTGAGESGDVEIKTGEKTTSGTDLHASETRVIIKRDTGNVGIGDDDPLYRLSVKGGASEDMVSSQSGFNIEYVKKPTTPTLALIESSGNLGEGTYTYTVTYTTDMGETEITSRPAITTDATHKQIEVTIPISPDPRVTGRKIYRTEVDGIYYRLYFVAEITDNTTTTYIDNIPDSSLGTTNVYYQYNSTSKGVAINGSTVMILDSQLTTFGIGAGNPNGVINSRSLYMGSNAGAKVTEGNGNVCLGYNAGGQLTTGSSNILIGQHVALSVNPTSSVIIGNYAGRSISGDGNTFIGTNSGYATSIQTGVKYNASLGMSSLQKVSTGAVYNVALGYKAGYNATGLSGSSNILIGALTGTDMTTAHHNILIGYNIEPSSITASYELNIGNAIYGNISTGDIGIGVGSPDSKLDVNGAITQRPLSSTPADPDIGNSVQWVDSATGDIKIKINFGGTVKTTTLVDFSSLP